MAREVNDYTAPRKVTARNTLPTYLPVSRSLNLRHVLRSSTTVTFIAITLARCDSCSVGADADPVGAIDLITV